MVVVVVVVNGDDDGRKKWPVGSLMILSTPRSSGA